ncbi:basic proline-rich protein-like [Corvus hawaiiensis]|uniref:basic proline-rich protein-like n=1 Tax=Corvus hawaiiensis TaxID=134902 RepID=UPI0020184C74|nr:basic proline-rich protein-like [Corvus hawaiiensis]
MPLMYVRFLYLVSAFSCYWVLFWMTAISAKKDMEKLCKLCCRCDLPNPMMRGLARATPPTRALRRGHVVPRASRDRGGGRREAPGGTGPGSGSGPGPGSAQPRPSCGPARALRAASPAPARHGPPGPLRIGRPLGSRPPLPSPGPPRAPRRSVTRRWLLGSSIVRRWRQPRDSPGLAERPVQEVMSDIGSQGRWSKVVHLQDVLALDAGGCKPKVLLPPWACQGTEASRFVLATSRVRSRFEVWS